MIEAFNKWDIPVLDYKDLLTEFLPALSDSELQDDVKRVLRGEAQGLNSESTAEILSLLYSKDVSFRSATY